MKRWRLLLAGLTAVAPLILIQCAPNVVPPSWEFLGKREVNFGIDRDTVAVSRSAGPLHQLLIIATMNPVEIWNIRVIFESGATHDSEIREKLFVGRDRLILDLPGGDRRVSEVSFRYRKLNNAARRAVVELYGK